MREVLWTDDKGYNHRSFLRDVDVTFSPEFGIPSDPPDVRRIDCEAMLKEMYNMLVDTRSFTRSELQKNEALVRVGNIAKRYVDALYREREKDNGKGV